jgi:multiple sugar transport system ATP-binding protein
LKQVGIKNVTKEFSSLRRGMVRALRDVNLDIAPGSFFVLLGPSGCGKTTLLNLVAGLERLTTGEIRIGDQLVASAEKKIFLTPRERDIAMVFQSYALYPHMTVGENIGFPLRMAKINRDEIASSVRKAAETLELLPFLDARPSELSGGQRQRVALGRAIVRSPSVLLLDEPLSNLDAILRISMRSELKEIQRRIGVTTIYVTHDQAEAMAMGDSITILRDGEIQQVGASTEIYEKPSNLFVARFIGNPPANVLTGKQLHDIKIHFGDSLRFDPSNVVAALRPEHIRIVSAEDGILTGEIKLTATLGLDTLFYIDVMDQQLICRALEKPQWKEEESVGLSFDIKNLLFFDKDDEKRRLMDL